MFLKYIKELNISDSIYILSVIVCDVAITLVAVHFSMKNITLSRDVGRTLGLGLRQRLPVTFFVYICLR